MFKKKCVFCKRKISKAERRVYLTDTDEKVYVCSQCVGYAERRAYQKGTR